MTIRPVRSTGPEMERHYRNVGLVAVATAQLEEVAAEIVYACKGGLDNPQGGWDDISDKHLPHMASSGCLKKELRTVVDALPSDAETRHVNPDDGSVRRELGWVKRRCDAFREGLAEVKAERDRIVHSVVGQQLWDSEPQAVHPLGIKRGNSDARRPLPKDGEISELVERIDDLIREGRRLSGQIAAIRNRGDSS